MKWTDTKIKQLKQLHDDGKGWLEISQIMNTTPDQVRMKYRNTFGETGTHIGITGDTNLDKPIIGLFDVETLPMESYTWGTYNQNIGLEEVISATGLLSWAGKFLNDAEVYSDILTPKEAPNKDDKRITKSCWEFLNKCDVVVGHNLIDFDWKVVNTFFLRHNLPPIKTVLVDTLKIARYNFRFDSNRLGFLNRLLNIQEKVKTDFTLWVDCHHGKKGALIQMAEYNKNDVVALEDLYYKLRPYIKNINFALYNETDKEMCPVCGGTNLKSNGFYYTSAGKWESVRCESCKAMSRRKSNLLSKGKKKKLLINS